MDGLGCYAIDEHVGFDTLSLLKKEAPTLLSDVSEEIKKPADPTKKDAKGGVKPDDKTKKPDKSSDQKSWFLRPIVGPVPGAGVLAIGAGLLGGIGYAVKRFFF